MICQPCKDAADQPNPELHELCENNRTEGTDTSHCDCHHRVGTRQNIQPEVIAANNIPIIPPQEPHRKL